MKVKYIAEVNQVDYKQKENQENYIDGLVENQNNLLSKKQKKTGENF